MKAKIFINDKTIRAKDDKFIRWWEDDDVIKSLEIHAYYNKIWICLEYKDDTVSCWEDLLEHEEGSDIYGTVQWGDHYLLNLEGENGRPVLQYNGVKLPFIRQCSIYFYNDLKPKFEIIGIESGIHRS